MPVFNGLSKAKEGKNTFDKEWAAKLAESEKGYSFQAKKFLDELNNNCNHKASGQAEMRASHIKIMLRETVKAEEIHVREVTKLKG